MLMFLQVKVTLPSEIMGVGPNPLLSANEKCESIVVCFHSKIQKLALGSSIELRFSLDSRTC